MESREDEIKRVKEYLEALKERRDGLKPSDKLHAERELALTEEITIGTRRLFFMEQQGNFHCTFPFLSTTYFCPIAFDKSTSPIQCR